jgi:hypothetical protein
MTAHAILIPDAIAAANVDAWNRSGVHATLPVDNGYIVALTEKSTTAGESEVFKAETPAASDPGLRGLWMVYEPQIVMTGGLYRGLDPDVRNFFTPALKVFSCFKLMVGDIITLTAPAFTAPYNSEAYAIATDTTGGMQFVFGAGVGSSVTALKWLKTTYISLAAGTLGDVQHVAAYQMEVVFN